MPIFKNQPPAEPLYPFTIIIGQEHEGVLSMALHHTKKVRYNTPILDFADPIDGLDEGRIPNYELNADLKAIILLNVDFKIHTQRIKKIVTQEYFEFTAFGSTQVKKVKRVPILICTPTAKDAIPWELFTDGISKIGFSDCRFDQ